MEEGKPITMESIIARLSNINKDELTEREFFQEVLSVIKDMKDLDFTEEEFKKFSSTLTQIGCVDYKTWKTDKLRNGFPMPEIRVETGIRQGRTATAAKFITQFMQDYNRAKYASSEENGWVQVWLKNSQKVLSGEKVDPDMDLYRHEALRIYIEELKDLAEEKKKLGEDYSEILEEISKLKNEKRTKDAESR